MTAPNIIVLDPSNITIDGAVAGKVVDVLANHASDSGNPDHAAFRAALHGALVSSHRATHDAHAAALKAQGDAYDTALKERDSEVQAAKDALAAELKTATDAHAAELARLNDAHSQEIDRLNATHKDAAERIAQQHAATRAQLAEMQARYIDLGGDAAWNETLPGRRTALQAAIAKQQAELERLDATTAVPTAQQGA